MLQRRKVLQLVGISLPHLLALLFFIETEVAQDDTHSCLTDTHSSVEGKNGHGKNENLQTAELHSEIESAITKTK